MIVLGVVQSLLALMTISPTLSEQFSALVNLAVVTNVLPYIIALSALMVMMQVGRRAGGQIPAERGDRDGRHALQHLRDLRLRQGRRPRRHARDRRSPSSSGASLRRALQPAPAGRGRCERSEVCLGGTFTMPLTPAKARRPGLWIGTFALALMAFGTPHASAQTLERIGDAGTIKLGYRPDARPFSFGAEGQQPAGYAVALCTLVADQIKTALGRADLACGMGAARARRLAPDRSRTERSIWSAARPRRR